MIKKWLNKGVYSRDYLSYWETTGNLSDRKQSGHMTEQK